MKHIAHIALLVKEYDEAINFYTKKLDFILLEDTILSNQKRWVLMAPPGAKECSLVLVKAANYSQSKSIGSQSGGRVFLFLFTDSFQRDFDKMIEREIKFVRQPEDYPFGRVAVFEDLYGNLWDLIEPSNDNKGLIKTY